MSEPRAEDDVVMDLDGGEVSRSVDDRPDSTDAAPAESQVSADHEGDEGRKDDRSVDDRRDRRREPFYLRYYSGHNGRFGHEFLEFDFLDDGSARYANNSNYRSASLIRKEFCVSQAVVAELKRIVVESEIMREDDAKWPPRNRDGKQELEIRLGSEHISFELAKIGSLTDVQESDDPEGLRVFYYLVQDIKAFCFSLISLHFKVSHPVSINLVIVILARARASVSISSIRSSQLTVTSFVCSRSAPFSDALCATC